MGPWYLGYCLLVVGLWLHGSVTALTIKQIIEKRTELTQMKTYLSRPNVDVYDKLAAPADLIQFTFFAVHNDAFQRIPPSVTGRSSFALNLDNMFKYHTCIGQEEILTTNQGFDNKRYKTIAEDTRYLFLRTVDGNFYVNGARVLEANIQADNGVVHIIDSLFYEPGQSVAAFRYISDLSQGTALPRASKFKKLLDAYGNSFSRAIYNLNHDLEGIFVTLFLPSDDAFANVDPATMRRLETNLEDLEQVIERHIIAGDVSKVYHSSLLEQYAESGVQETSPLVAMDGHIKLKVFRDELYVSNSNCGGKVTKANITLTNGVVHIVDNVIGWQHSDIFGQIETDKDLNEFESYIKKASPGLQDRLRVPAGSTLQVDDRSKITIFAPTNGAFYKIQNKLPSFDISQNATHLDSIINMHMVQGLVEWSDMTEGQERQTKQSGYSVSFHETEKGTFVEVDHVRAQVVRADVCSKNGMVHYVDGLLGVPFLTILDEIEANDELASLYEVLSDTAMDVPLRDPDRKLTFFATVNAGFERMQEGEVGRQLLSRTNTYRLQNVIKRHRLNKELYMSALDDTADDSMTVTSEFGSWELKKNSRNGYQIEYKSTIVNIIEADIKLVNGVLHIIDGVIYDEDPSELDVSAGGASLTPFLITTLLAQILKSLV